MTMDLPIVINPPASADAEDLRAYATTRDAEAFARVVRRHIDLVYSLCRRDLRNEHLAEDAAQAVFILLAAKAGTFGDNCRLIGWLYETSRNCCRNARRSQSRRARHESSAAMERPEMNTPSPAGNIESEELAQSVHAALSRLRRRDRDLLLMRYFQRMTSRQVAQFLAVTEEAAKQRTARALRNLRALMNPSQDASDWLERGALLVAPSRLASQAAHSATTGAAGVPATIAKAVTSAAHTKLAAIILITAAAGIGAIGGAIHFASPPAIQAPINVAAAPPIAPPISAPPAAAVVNPQEAKERSTPVDCLRAISAREKSLDAAGLEACLYDDGSDMAKILKHTIRVDIAQIRLSNAAKSAFGPDADVFHEISSPTTSAVIDLLLVAAPPDVQINGDTATMPLRLPPTLQQTAMKDWQGMTIRFVRSPADGGWKVNLASAIMYVSYLPGKDAKPVAMGSTIAFLDVVAEVADRVSGEISRHEIAGPELIGSRFNFLINQERMAKGIQIIGGRTLPRSGAAKTPTP